MKLKIGVIGVGYVGLTTAIGLASKGFKVVCIDKDKTKIDKLNNGEIPLYETGLLEAYNYTIDNITYTTNLNVVKNCNFIIVAVGTPTAIDGYSADLKYIRQVAKDIKALNISKKIILAIKSTVPVGTCDKVEKIIDNKNVIVISMPEFLREGCALIDTLTPDRVVIGSKVNVKKEIESLFTNYKATILYTDRRSSELIKYASNSFLAIKIHYINEIADLCESVGANIKDVAYGVGLDSRIGNKFLNAGIGYGGSCFPKDTKALDYLAKSKNVKLSLVDSAIKGNEDRITKFAKQIDYYKNIAVFGLTFKANTDDCRESPSIKLINKLSGNVSVYDPKGMENAKKYLTKQVTFGTPYEIVKDKDVLVIATEWNEFKQLDYNKIYKLMKNKNIIDLRNILKNKSKFNVVNVGNYNG